MLKLISITIGLGLFGFSLYLVTGWTGVLFVGAIATSVPFICYGLDG